MTNEEAISILKNAAFLSTETKYQAIEEAVNMAITALQTDGDTISRADAIRVASGYCHPANVAKELANLPSVQPEKLTDKEQRIFLSAMGREEEVCKEVDDSWRDCREPYEDSLVHVCKEIRRKVKGTLWT